MRLDEQLAPEYQALASHPIYGLLDTLPRVRRFMEHHVFAVWDFMALLSSLQHSLARSPVPWRPPRSDRYSQRLLHELVLVEATDEDPRGGYISHLELYVDAMVELDADIAPITRLLSMLAGQPMAAVPMLAAKAGAPPAACHFVAQTMTTLVDGNVIDVAAAFAYGREQLIPTMFAAVQLRVDAPLLRWYLDRHVEVDGDLHGPLSRRLVDSVCDGYEDRHRALRAARRALAARARLWDGAVAALQRV